MGRKEEKQLRWRGRKREKKEKKGEAVGGR